MDSGEPRRISSGSLPQWMKTKALEANTPRDFDAQFASPPAHDDSFFLIRYPNTGSLFNSGAKTQETGGVRVSQPAPQADSKREGPDWSRHTQPCQQFITGVPFGALSKCPPSVKPKPAGTDDGFKGDGAACGSSIVRVAHQMISSRGSNSRGMSVEPISEDGTLQFTKGADAAAATKTDSLAPSPAYLNMRRGSKSLPATPLSSPPGSPGSKRKNKNIVNRFFTSPFEVPADVSGNRSWILAGLLGQQREAYSSSITINEEDHASLAASVESLAAGVTSNADATKLAQQFSSNQDAAAAAKSQVYRPKPSELREMNFWSPTSM